STGKNLGYGGAAPSLTGSVVLDLKRMNRVLEVDERQGSCLVEPGVSYFDMYRHLQSMGSKLWIDCPDPGWGSMIGNALDHGVGYTMAQLRNHFGAQCGMEVVLPNGELLRTGMGALPGAKTWQQYKGGYGPWIDGVFSQSNFGIVTKMGFWLMRQPEAFLKGSVFVPGLRDIIPLVDVVTELENTRIVTGIPDFMSPLMASPSLAELDQTMEHGPKLSPQHLAMLQSGAPLEQMEKFGRENGIASWGCHLNFYGPEKVIRAQWEHAQEQLRQAIPGAVLKEYAFHKLPLDENQREQVRLAEFGIPSLRAFSVGARSPWNPDPGIGHMAFSPIIPRTGEAVLEAMQVMSEAARKLGVRMINAVAPYAMYERALVFIAVFQISNDAADNRKMRAAFRELIKIGAKHGWGEYRTPVAFQDDVMATFSFNNHALRRFHETVKDALDPNGILSPGRYGIWPKRLRKVKP
ncbi:MAG TPA: FAD-binding protein, partial [Ramlibacter sp.]|nr:FAD-binding protein [Ramlibacter sp.]